MYFAQRFEVSEVVIPVADKDIDLHNILHLPASRFDHRVEIMQDLLILGYQVGRCGDAALSIAASLTGQEEELPTCHKYAVAET